MVVVVCDLFVESMTYLARYGIYSIYELPVSKKWVFDDEVVGGNQFPVSCA